VTLFPGERTDPFIVSPLLSLQAKTIELECAASPEHLDAIASAPYLTAVSTTGSVKVQFRLEGIRIDDRASRRPRLSAPIPSFAWRVQRRNDFRVQPPEPDEATVVVRRPREGELVTRLIDLSAGGVSMQWPRDVSMPFGLGTTLHHCRIEAAPIAPIPCDLRVVRIQSGEPFVISCEFYAMPQEVSRFVQMYVMDVERRLRR
jgi:c-di-GMP-binding flagellar brake protein YcgR